MHQMGGPAHERRARKPDPAVMQTTPDDFSLLRVLVIDDQSHVRHWVRTVLQKAGITDIVDAGDGREALAAVTSPGGRFDLILCDLRMPERDGIETIRAFAALGIDSAIAIMSVEDERFIETAGLLASAQGLRLIGTVPKPLTADKLQTIVARMRAGTDDPVSALVMAPEEDLKHAFQHGEFVLQYQPMIYGSNAKLAGVEALVRWEHPTLGMFQPAD